MKTTDLLSVGMPGVRFILRRLVSISCLLALLAFPGGSFAASRIGNLSTRANVGTGNNNVILGTILVGSGTATLVFRGIGPSLPFGGANLANPYLEIVNASGGSIGSNNNWQDYPPQASLIQSAGLAPSNPNESAFWVQLGAGSYTAVLSGVGGGTGIGLVEVWDITSQPSSIKLGNVSTRANAGTGNNTEIFGIMILGGNKSLGLRGLGPSLTLPGKLANPALSLRTSGGALLQFNQDWQDSLTQRSLILAYGFAPSNALESAMVTGNLNGTYTVFMETAGASGIASIEAYDLGELLGAAGGSGSVVCNSPGGGAFDIGGSGPFTLPAGTKITLRYGGYSDEPNCPACPASPGCGVFSWSMEAVLLDLYGTVIPITNSGISGFGQCTIQTKTVTWAIPPNYTPSYLLRIRGHHSNPDCTFSSSILNLDYHALNGP